MWRRLYLFLLVVRLYFALSPSYIHPDEHFQGPEMMANQVFDWPANPTWEFTSQDPIRSFFPLWLAYGFPLTLLKWVWEGLGYGAVKPMLAFYCLRTTMFILSFVLEDWALHELLPSPRERTRAIALVASSYVTWTFQMHTFSNGIETLLVLWCLVLIRRIRDNPDSTMASACAGLSFMVILGIFNRITFPAWLILPSLQLLPHLFKRTLRIPILLTSALFTLAIAVTVDTEIYAAVRPSLWNIADTTIFTPLNALTYNLKTSNLATHGLHPYYQHLLINLPMLLGPATPLLLTSSRKTTPFLTALLGIAILSIIPHQEPRFLLPAIPLLLTSINTPKSTPTKTLFLTTWILFNATLGLLFGTYHQAGILPAQNFLLRHTTNPTATPTSHIVWWKTYPPPTYLDGPLPPEITVKDHMGLDPQKLISELYNKVSCEMDGGAQGLLVAPASATFLDKYVDRGGNGGMYGATVRLKELWRTRAHIGLDDLEWGREGVWGTLRRVIGRRGLVVWGVRKKC